MKPQEEALFDQWIKRHRAGDSSVLKEIIQRYEIPLYCYILKHFRLSPEDAYDILQEVCVKVFEHLSELQDAKNFQAWLYRIVVNKVIDHFRKKLPSQESLINDNGEVRDWVSHDPWPLYLFEIDLIDALQMLSAEHRNVFILHFHEGYGVPEIAQITGITEGTVKSRLHYACKALREYLES